MTWVARDRAGPLVRVQFDRTSDDVVRFLFLGADETGRALEVIALVPGGQREVCS